MPFPFFEISNDFCQKSYNGFRGFLVISTLPHKYFWSTHLWQWNRGPFIFFWNLHGYAFCLFFLNKRNITTCLLMTHLKCTVVHYANLNSSSINKLFLNYRPLNILFRFFRFLIYVYFMKLLSKNLWNNYHF